MKNTIAAAIIFWAHTVTGQTNELPPVPDEQVDMTTPSFALKQSADLGTVAIVAVVAAGVAAAVLSQSDTEDAQGSAIGVGGLGVAVGMGFAISSQARKREAARRLRYRGL